MLSGNLLGGYLGVLFWVSFVIYAGSGNSWFYTLGFTKGISCAHWTYRLNPDCKDIGGILSQNGKWLKKKCLKKKKTKDIEEAKQKG